MSAKPSPPQQETVERRLRDCFKNGDISGVAAWLGRDVSGVSRELNPEEPAQSDVFRCLRFMDSCGRVRHELFEDVSAIVLDFINSRSPRQTTGVAFNTRDLTEAINLYLEKASLKDQLKAVRRAMSALRERETFLMVNDLEDSEDEENPMRKAVVKTNA